MSVNIRVRNGMAPDAGTGGVSEGDLRGNSSDIFESTDGVVDLSGGHLLVHEAASPAMTVVVDPGIGYIPNDAFDEIDSDSVKFWEGIVAGTTASRTLVIGANSSGQTRIDLVCLNIDPGATPDKFGSDVAVLIIVAGTPGSAAPATPSYHTKLAEITVLNGATEITDDKIVDFRTQLKIKNAIYGKRVIIYPSATSITPVCTTTDVVQQTNVQGAGTLTINAPTGTPINTQVLLFRIKSTNAQIYAFNAIYRAGTNLPLPTTHDGSSKTDYFGFMYNSTDSKWDLLALLQTY